MNIAVSPSRTYIAMCNKGNFDGYYFRRFVLPEGMSAGSGPERFENSTTAAAWYFLNVLNFVACIDGCFPAEDLGPAADLVPLEPGSVKIIGTNIDGHDT
jgi:hypothetical protein